MERLSVRGAREHNLRNVDLDLPRDALIVFTGLSGSGKSSLAFDTIFAEGQRRYVESLSSYARQFLGQMDKPDVDFIEGLSPAVSIDQKSTSRNPRSTVGTITEIYDYLRLLFARIGRPHCPVCGELVTKQTPQAIVDRVLEMPESTRFQVLAPVVRDRKGEFVDLLSSLTAPGVLPGAGRRRGQPDRRGARAEEAGEALDRGGRRPAHREDDAPASASPTRWRRPSGWPRASSSSTSSTCPTTTRTGSAATRRRWPARTTTRWPWTNSSRGRSRSTRRSAPARCARVSAPGRRSTPSWSSPTPS